MNGKFISSQRIVDKLYMDFPFFDTTMNFGTIMEWIGDALTELKVPCWYTDKITDGNKQLNHQDYIEIKDYRGKLPCDLYLIRQCAAVMKHEGKCAGRQSFIDQYGCIIPVSGIAYVDLDGNGTVTTDCGGLIPSMITSQCNVEDHCYYIPMRWSTNTFHKAYHANNIDFCMCSDVTYTVNNNYIFTSFKEGKVAMSYLAVPTDENNLPLIPDSQSVIAYVTWYVALKYAFQMYMTDKYTEAKYNEFKGYAQLYYMKSKNEGKMPKSLDEWESYKNLRMRRIPKLNDHKDFFRNLQREQQTWIHPRINAWGNVGGTTSIV